MNVFDLLNNDLKILVKDRFKIPTLPQELAIPKILEGKNVLLMAPTGFGKTESALIPLFDIWMKEKPKPISILYITPLKALNRDMLKRILWWSEKIGIGVAVRHGDTTQYERKMQSENPDDLFVTTPEQLQAMLTSKKFREYFQNLKYVIVDEVHELVDNKRGVQLSVAIQRLKELSNFKIIGLSATVKNPEDAKMIFSSDPFEVVDCSRIREKEIIVEIPKPVPSDQELADKLFILPDSASRIRRINEIIKNSDSCLIFTNTRESAETLSSRLRFLDSEIKQDIHHSSLSKEVRLDVEDKFKKEEIKAIIATSSLQLGIDIGSINTVVQYQSPREVSQFLQRVGRSGHGILKKPKGIILCSEGDDIFESAVIARKALSGELENLPAYKNAMDILAHQIIGILLIDYECDVDRIYELIKKSHPYRNLTKKSFEDLLKFMHNTRLIWFENGRLKRTKKAIKYYYENLSSIPDSKTYKVIDITTNMPVGTLDEGFIADHSEPGASFIVKGRPWKLVEIENMKVFVEPFGSIESSVPAWEGELIPVPFDVAQEVGRLRRILDEKEIMKNYPVNQYSAEKMVKFSNLQKKFAVPDDKTIVIEKYDNYHIIHSCFGSKVNETLNRFISSMISLDTGRPIASKSDPYRIIISGVTEEQIEKVLDSDPESMEFILSKTLQNTSIFKHRFLNIAKRFGIIEKTANIEKIKIEKLVDIYRETPIYDETLNEIFTEKLDVDKAKEVLSSIKNEKIKIIKIKGLSPLGEMGLKYELHDIAKPDRPEEQILELLKKRIENTKLRLICVNCGKYSLTKVVKDIEDFPICSKCGSKLIGITHPSRTETIKIVQKRLKGSAMSSTEMKVLETMRRSADLMIVYGKKAAIVLAGRGIGPQTASRIIARMHKTEKELYRDILDAERTFIQTKKYWKE